MEVWTPTNVRTFIENYDRIQEKSKYIVEDEVVYNETSTLLFPIKKSKEYVCHTP